MFLLSYNPGIVLKLRRQLDNFLKSGMANVQDRRFRRTGHGNTCFGAFDGTFERRFGEFSRLVR
jgi:hypothetical protein